MSGFDSQRKQGDAPVQQAPDFTTAIASYNAMVQEIAVKIKAGKKELTLLLSKIDQAKADYQFICDKRVEDMGGEYDKLIIDIANAQAAFDSLATQIAERQATKDSISLDNIAKQADLDAAWDAIHKSAHELADASIKLDADRKAVQDYSDKVDLDVQKLNDDKAAFAIEYAAKMSAIKVGQDAVNVVKNDAATTLQLAQDTQAKIDASQKALDAATEAAQPILAQADAVAKQKAANDTALAINSTNAAQNDRDAAEIRVARVAINNQKQELSDRETMVALAEKNIGGK